MQAKSRRYNKGLTQVTLPGDTMLRVMFPKVTCACTTLYNVQDSCKVVPLDMSGVFYKVQQALSKFLQGSCLGQMHQR